MTHSLESSTKDSDHTELEDISHFPEGETTVTIQEARNDEPSSPSEAGANKAFVEYPQANPAEPTHPARFATSQREDPALSQVLCGMYRSLRESFNQT
ncbi:unnamed protein product [Merluccius merluccius]